MTNSLPLTCAQQHRPFCRINLFSTALDYYQKAHLYAQVHTQENTDTKEKYFIVKNLYFLNEMSREAKYEALGVSFPE